jgi:hypothetical protein
VAFLDFRLPVKQAITGKASIIFPNIYPVIAPKATKRLPKSKTPRSIDTATITRGKSCDVTGDLKCTPAIFIPTLPPINEPGSKLIIAKRVTPAPAPTYAAFLAIPSDFMLPSSLLIVLWNKDLVPAACLLSFAEAGEI